MTDWIIQEKTSIEESDTDIRTTMTFYHIWGTSFTIILHSIN